MRELDENPSGTTHTISLLVENKPGVLHRIAGLMLQDGQLIFDDMFWYGLFPVYFGIVPPGEARDRLLRGLTSGEAAGIEVESYLPEVYYRYGEDKAAYGEILKLTDPAKPRPEQNKRVTDRQGEFVESRSGH